jgi:DNA polymerase-3 subunit gamma/tau
MSLALYRKYRPAQFADVIGQEHVTKPLTRALESDRIHHAYLFTGPRGCGKTSSARIMARSMNCVNGPTASPCGTCQSCVDLAPNGPGSIDVIEIDAATYRGIDDAKELRERAIYAPVNSRFKVYIIDEAHQLTKDAFNVLLKLVEEPPEHLRFIFATTEPDKIIPTLRSRTHHYPFRLVSAKTLQEHMASLCGKENITFEPSALTLIARAGAGSVRDSLSVLGQIIAGSGPEGITYSETVSLLGFTDDVLLSQVIDAIAAGDAAALFELIDQVVSSGHEPRRFAMDLLERMRDLVVVKQVPDSSNSGLFDLPAETIAELVKQAANFSPAQLVRVADLVNVGLSELRGAASPRLQLELLVARLVTPEVTNDLVERVAKLEQSGVSAPTSRPSIVREQAAQAPSAVPAPEVDDTPAVVVKPVEAPLPSRKPNAAPPLKPSQVTGAARKAQEDKTTQAPEPKFSGDVDIDVLRKNWPLILEKMRENSKVAHTLVSETRPLSLVGGILVVGFAQAGMAKNAANSPHLATLRTIINDVFGVKVQIDPTLDPDASKITAPKKTETVETGDADPDDADVAEISTIDLIAKTLGATVISESPRE